jgi:hypothetical protein
MAVKMPTCPGEYYDSSVQARANGVVRRHCILFPLHRPALECASACMGMSRIDWVDTEWV